MEEKEDISAQREREMEREGCRAGGMGKGEPAGSGRRCWAWQWVSGEWPQGGSRKLVGGVALSVLPLILGVCVV